ncbi:unnamed protein product [Cuscuta campestris]|uniref:DUF4219 domain-containing protein n=1 Tax=Cuscuta campestris TaxID=132261 RepID=A0A484KMY7_9ASTE|nr:unnamed protein product [Cuscuta campestris]
MVNNMDHGLPKFSLLGYDDWKIMMKAHLYALHNCMWMVLEERPLKIQMESPERDPKNPDVVQYIPKPKHKWDDRDCKKHNLDNVAKAAIFKTLDHITFSKIKHLKTAMEIWQVLGKLCEGSEDLRKQKIEVLLEKFKCFKMLPGKSFDLLDERFHKILNDLASLNDVLSPKEKNISLFDKFKKMMEDFEEINLKHSSLKEEKKLLSDENLTLAEGRKSQLIEITQLKAQNESLSEKVKSLNKEIGILKSKEAVDKLLDTAKRNGLEGLGFDPSSSKRKERTTFILPKPTAQPNKQKGKEKEKPKEVPKKIVSPKHYRKQDKPQRGNNFRRKPSNPHYTGGYSLEFCNDMASLKSISTNEGILIGKRIRNIYEVMWENVKEACLISKELSVVFLAKSSSPAFFKAFLEMIDAQGLSEFLNLEFHNKYEEDVLEFYTNGEIQTSQSKRDPIKSTQIIHSTVGDKEVKISQKKLRTKLHLSKSGIDIGKLSPKALNWSEIQISRKVPTGPTKKGDLKNDYKLLLELIIGCLECGSGGHAHDITHKRAFIIDVFISKTHVATDGKKYEERYWLYYLSRKGESKASSVAEEEGSSNEVLATTLKKVSKTKQVASSSQNAEEPQNLELVVLDQEKVSDQGELHKKKKKISTPSESGNANPENSQQHQDTFQVHEGTHEQVQGQSPLSPSSQHLTDERMDSFIKMYIEWRAWKVDDEDTTVFKPIFSNPAMDTQGGHLEEEAEEEIQEDVEAAAEEIQTNPENSSAPETKQAENLQEDTAIPQTEEETQAEEQIQAIEEAEVPINEHHNEEVVRDPLSQDISDYRNEDLDEASVKMLRIGEEDVRAEKEADSLPLQCFHSPPPTNQVTNFNFHCSTSTPTLPDEMHEPWAKRVQGMIDSALESQRASFQEVLGRTEERHNSNLQEIRNSLNKTLEIISQMSSSMSTMMMTYASDSHFQLKEVGEIKEHMAAIRRSLQKQMGLLHMDIRSALAISSTNQCVTQDYLKVLVENQKEFFRLLKGMASFTTRHKLDVTVQYTLLDAQKSNPELSLQHLSRNELDVTEAIGTEASHFTNEGHQKEHMENLKRIRAECGVIEGLGAAAAKRRRT